MSSQDLGKKKVQPNLFLALDEVSLYDLLKVLNEADKKYREYMRAVDKVVEHLEYLEESYPFNGTTDEVQIVEDEIRRMIDNLNDISEKALSPSHAIAKAQYRKE